MEQELLRLLDQLPIGALIVERDHKIQYLNKAFAAFTGYEVDELLGTNMDKLSNQSYRSLEEKIDRLFNEEIPYFEVETRYRRKDGSFVWGSPVRMLHPHPAQKDGQTILIFIVDITERRELSQRLRQAEQMNALGTLASGIAHDFNNLLTLITSFTEILSDEPENRDLQEQAIAQIRDACRRGEELTSRLLELGKPETGELGPIDVHELLEQIQYTFSRVFPSTISIELFLDKTPLQIYADEARLHQILTNLLINARQAMDDCGKVEITTRLLAADARELSQLDSPLEDDYCKISICDTGKGISRKLLPHIFKPFFTTKGDEGTGMGLSTVYSMVQQNRGFMRVKSEEGEGSCFYIYLPVVY